MEWCIPFTQHNSSAFWCIFPGWSVGNLVTKKYTLNTPPTGWRPRDRNRGRTCVEGGYVSRGQWWNYLKNREFLLRNYRLIVAPWKFDILKSSKYFFLLLEHQISAEQLSADSPSTETLCCLNSVSGDAHFRATESIQTKKNYLYIKRLDCKTVVLPFLFRRREAP